MIQTVIHAFKSDIDRRTEPHFFIKVNDFACNLVRPPAQDPRRKLIVDDFRNPWIRIGTVGAEHCFHLNYIGRWNGLFLDFLILLTFDASFGHRALGHLNVANTLILLSVSWPSYLSIVPYGNNGVVDSIRDGCPGSADTSVTTPGEKMLQRVRSTHVYGAPSFTCMGLFL